VTTLLKVGTSVRIYPDQVHERIPKKLAILLKEDPSGRFFGYKITDGKGVGMVLELSDGSIGWFFDYELDTKAIGHSELIFSPHSKKAVSSDSRTYGNSILELLNPFYFLEWLTFSLKDVF